MLVYQRVGGEFGPQPTAPGFRAAKIPHAAAQEPGAEFPG